MSEFDFSTLITDRSQADLEALRSLLATPLSDWTAEQLAEFNLAKSKGAYNYTDLNRVTACMDYLNEVLTAAGYVTGYQPILIDHSGEPTFSGRLPIGYTEVEYIESTGGQYIATGVMPDQDTRVVMDVAPNEEQTAEGHFFSVRHNNVFFVMYFQPNLSSWYNTRFGTQAVVGMPTSLNNYSRVVIDKNQNVTTVAGQSVSANIENFNIPYQIPLFGRNTSGTFDTFISAKLYSCKIYKGGVLLRNFIPCQNQTKEVGLYDTVSAQFYGNKGTGKFSSGPSVISYALQNIVPNSSFEQTSNWSGAVYDTAEKYQGERSSKLGPSTTITQTGAVQTPVVGHQYYGRSYIKSQGDIQSADNRYELYAGDGPGLNFVFARNIGNFPNWTMQSSVVPVTAVNGSSYIIRNFVVSAVNPCWTDCLMIVDLTAAFGEGNEPDKDWCDQNLPYFSDEYVCQKPPTDPHVWIESDRPTESQLEQYLENISAFRGALAMGASLPSVPVDMEGLTMVEANNIETILDTLHDHILAMQKIFLPTGILWAISGGPNFYFAN